MRGALVTLLAALPSCSLLRGTPVPVSQAHGVTPGGVVWQDTLRGVGPVATPESRVTIHYVATIPGGRRLDSSHDRGLPETFDLADAPVAGWSEGIRGMRERGARRLIVPPELAYGAEGLEGLVPPDTALEFVVELIAVEDARE